MIIADGVHSRHHQNAVAQQGQLCQQAMGAQCMVEAVVYLSETGEKKNKRKRKGENIMVAPGQPAGNDQPWQGDGILYDHFNGGKLCQIFPLNGF